MLSLSLITPPVAGSGSGNEKLASKLQNQFHHTSSVDAGVPYRRQNELKTTEIFCENRRYRQSDPGR
ncbi:hypothetical protein KQS06HV_91378 [Klebsiella quasipneumoniae subsp. similipneumoniae]|nr:hypothetical protein KQS06HV_91378 [Klebsiella quasipneumoniae subsp. similipneumoniae]